MPTFTKHLNLRKPEENDFYNQEIEQCENWDKLDEWSEGIDSKTKGATSLVPGIVKYGTDASTALEGSKLAEIYGIEPGGNLNNTNLKNAGKAYYCTVNKKTYKCIANTSINYADADYFEEISNNDLLGKLKNLYDKGITDKTFQTSYGTLVIYERIIGTIKFFIFELNLNTINSGLNTLSLNKIEEVTGLNIYDYTFEVNSSYNADVNINVQYQNNTMRINSKNTKPEGNAFIIRGFSRLIYTN